MGSQAGSLRVGVRRERDGSVSNPSYVSKLSPTSYPLSLALRNCRKPFTLRQQQILALIALGDSNKEIGYELGISRRTVGAHLDRLYRQYGLHSRAAAAALSVHVTKDQQYIAELEKENLELRRALRYSRRPRLSPRQGVARSPASQSAPV